MFRNVVTDVFFDLDHTLWDFERNSALTFQKIFIDYGIDLDLNLFLAEYVPANLAYWKLFREGKIGKEDLRYQRLRTVFDAVRYRVEDDMIHSLANAYIEHLSSHDHLVPNTREILEYLKPKYRLHIITNGFEEVQAKKMRNSGIDSFFDQVINSEMAGVKKPHPAIFRLALERTRALPQHAIMVGDNLEADILGARTAGIHTIHLNVHKEPPHEHGVIIHDLREIKLYL
ncbi:putative hydrolase of the HAD superfamily [Muriicola jejuensis]|uniref:Noncanonical pyrimidine nucleotidase, YjjG family n=1 Tax=Muriicola jejuensis TaxID=504488 RepID=A0A6P0UBC4_9FLAO|nr:YjjG family noncanonical pyrimidine nucleotidase [Muriicola jejuensis]NER10494.1 noncanonical pyrimidine nucleotidase, YjjG family [Muriicola jejuensis]SMP18510.1 putative hydrolase of the HAD superfamily [Muriicola jejuensis]